MSFFDRLKLSLRADAHGMLDALQDEQLLLKQHLREAESALMTKHSTLAQLDTESKQLAGDRQRATVELAALERDAELALAQERDDLARYALKLLIAKQRLIERIDRRVETIAVERQRLEPKLAEQQVELEELRVRVQSFLAERAHGTTYSAPLIVSDEQIEIELIRRKASRSGSPPAEPSHV